MRIPEPGLVVVAISANGEWRAAVDILRPAAPQKTPFGEWFSHTVNGRAVTYIHSGWGKVSTAAAAQYAIDRWSPELMINLGTCGGLEGMCSQGDILLVTETVMYDILEGMSDFDAAVDFYRASNDYPWINAPLPERTYRSRLATADQDIQHHNHTLISDRFASPAADWESGAFAWVCSRNETAWLILRGVSDIVTPHRSETDGNVALWDERVPPIMSKLLGDVPFYLDQFQQQYAD